MVDFSGGDAIDEMLQRMGERFSTSVKDMVFRHLEEEFGGVSLGLLQRLMREIWF